MRNINEGSWKLLNHSPDFEEASQVVDLSDCHGDKDQSFKEWPHNHSGIGVFVDRPVDSITDRHVLLFVFDSWKDDIIKTRRMVVNCLDLPVKALLSSLIMTSSLLWEGSSPSSRVVGASPMSIVNITIFGVMVLI